MKVCVAYDLDGSRIDTLPRRLAPLDALQAGVRTIPEEEGHFGDAEAGGLPAGAPGGKSIAWRVIGCR